VCPPRAPPARQAVARRGRGGRAAAHASCRLPPFVRSFSPAPPRPAPGPPGAVAARCCCLRWRGRGAEAARGGWGGDGSACRRRRPPSLPFALSLLLSPLPKQVDYEVFHQMREEYRLSKTKQRDYEAKIKQ